ncbi:MAG: hypothetical protein AB8B87_12410 [Granulosicoccus sp.]
MNNTTLLTAIGLTLFLSACSDGTVQSGGGAGDTDRDDLAVALITPFVGFYDLPDNWRGSPASEAYLEIQAPASNGVAVALVHQVNTINVCIETGASPGEVTKDPFSDRVFLDSFTFGNAVLTLEGTDLLINLSEDVQDIDDDNNFDEPNQLRATMPSSDLPEFCQ